jgi:hypothetical protein
MEQGEIVKYGMLGFVLCAAMTVHGETAAQQTAASTYLKLTSDTVVDGIRCGSTGRWKAGFFASGRLESCPLAAESAVGGHTLPAQTWIHLTETGRLTSIWLPRNAAVQGYVCRGSGNRGWSVSFHPAGGLRTCYLAQEAVLDGVPCRKGSFWGEIRGDVSITLHANGRLASCSAARTFTIDARSYRKRERVFLDAEGRPRDPQ